MILMVRRHRNGKAEPQTRKIEMYIGHCVHTYPKRSRGCARPNANAPSKSLKPFRRSFRGMLDIWTSPLTSLILIPMFPELEREQKNHLRSCGALTGASLNDFTETAEGSTASSKCSISRSKKFTNAIQTFLPPNGTYEVPSLLIARI